MNKKTALKVAINVGAVLLWLMFAWIEVAFEKEMLSTVKSGEWWWDVGFLLTVLLMISLQACITYLIFLGLNDERADARRLCDSEKEKANFEKQLANAYMRG